MTSAALRISSAVSLALAMTSVSARDIAVDYRHCAAGTVTLISASKELTLVSFEHRGITQSNNGEKTLDSQTIHCVGITKVSGGQNATSGSCKFQSPEGDSYVGEFSRLSPVTSVEGIWTVLQGTGRWQGMTGSAKWKGSTSTAKAITPGTTQFCLDVKGTYSLPN